MYKWTSTVFWKVNDGVLPLHLYNVNERTTYVVCPLLVKIVLEKVVLPLDHVPLGCMS